MKGLKKMSDDAVLPTMEDSSRTCPGQLEIPTPREQKALAAMRAIKEQVKPLKARLTVLEQAGQGSGGDAMALREELSRLKADWNAWESERKAAAKERMIILGHEAPE